MSSGPDHRCSILVVEDEPDLQDVFRVALEADGYRVSVVDNGRDALRHLQSTAGTCLIVLDLTMPVMGGKRFRVKQLRDRSLAWLPVVVVSGAPEAARDARDLQAKAFIPKPMDVDALREAVRRVGCPLGLARVEQRRRLDSAGSEQSHRPQSDTKKEHTRPEGKQFDAGCR